METSELRGFSVDELKTKVRAWKEELFRSRFKAESTEAKDTSVFRKLKKDIARGLTILNEKRLGVVVETKQAPSEQPTDKVVEAAPKTKRAKKPAASSKTKKKTGTKKK